MEIAKYVGVAPKKLGFVRISRVSVWLNDAPNDFFTAFIMTFLATAFFGADPKQLGLCFSVWLYADRNHFFTAFIITLFASAIFGVFWRFFVRIFS